MDSEEEYQRSRCCTMVKCRTVFLALSVRLVLIMHNVLCVWRVVNAYDSGGYWAMASANILMIIEAILVLYHNGGLEWKWWCPCFAVYLITTLPPIWLLQLAKYDEAVAELSRDVVFDVVSNRAAALTSGTGNGTIGPNVTMASTTEQPVEFPTDLSQLFSMENETWIVIVMDALIYLIVFARWLLPRKGLSREALAELVLEFLGTASDIMELLSIFDEDNVRTNLSLTYAILAIWSISFFQFVPVLAHNNEYTHLHSKSMRKIINACGDSFAEVVRTCISIFMQDGPFLCLRLYVMIQLDLINYSLVFFVLKNIVTLMILFYRLGILCVRLPCCYKEEADILEVEDVDFSKPVLFGGPNLIFRHSAATTMNGSVNSSNDMSAFPYIISTKS